MCGITGFSGSPAPHIVKQLLETIDHRGRDESVIWTDQRMNIGMTRLAIKDLSLGLYPMCYKQYVLVFNGEIYNSSLLKRSLTKKGIPFKTSSDAEVILPLFDLYGPASFSHLDGMFAVAMYDTLQKRIILARDKTGEKPLYYTIVKHQLYFASEMKALLQLNKIPKTVNRSALAEYLQQGYVFAPETLVEGIYKLQTAHYLTYSCESHTASIMKYWKPSIEQSLQDNGNHEDELDHLLRQSVRSRLMGDVDFGCFLSGGIDSSMIARYAAESVPVLKTYSVAFPEALKNDESFFSRKVATWLGADHTEISCNAAAVLPVAEKIGRYIDEPVSDPACLPTFLLAKAARKSVKFVLTGEGADELFGGYHRYWKALYAANLRKLLEHLGLSPFLRFMPSGRLRRLRLPLSEHYNTQGIWNCSELNDLIRAPSAPIAHPQTLTDYKDINPLLAMQCTDLAGYLPDQLFMKVDKMTMANNLEARAPIVSDKLISFGLNLPQHDKIRYFQGKYILKKVASRYFPFYFTWRPKHGFTLPLGRWLKGTLFRLVESSACSIDNRPELFNGQLYRTVIDAHLSGETDHADKIWSLIVLTQWMDEYDIKT